MTERSVFVSRPDHPYFAEVRVQTEWFGGFALSQKRKCEIALHRSFLAAYPDEKPLEVSSSSLYELGTRLSAMHLSKQTASGLTTVESAFQSSRIYDGPDGQIGPFPEYLFLPGRESKKLVRERSLGLVSHRYLFDGMAFPTPPYHVSLFYDYLFLNALLETENAETAGWLLRSGFTAFSDLATLSLNSQARSCAIFIGLYRAGLLDQVREYETYLALFRTKPDGTPVDASAYENAPCIVGDKLRYALPTVPCSFTKAQTEAEYAARCAALHNRKGDPNNFLPESE